MIVVINNEIVAIYCIAVIELQHYCALFGPIKGSSVLFNIATSTLLGFLPSVIVTFYSMVNEMFNNLAVAYVT